jgi:hypothetical protein
MPSCRRSASASLSVWTTPCAASCLTSSVPRSRLRVRRRHSGEVLPSGLPRSRALRVALDAVEGSRRLHRYDEDQAESRRREAGIRLREDRSEALSGNAGRRNVASLSPSRMDWWIIGVNRSVDFSCLPTTSAAIRWRDPHSVGWLQGPHHCRPDPARMERPHFVGWLQTRSFVDQTRPEDGKTLFRGGRHYKARSTDGETPFRGGGYKR